MKNTQYPNGMLVMVGGEFLAIVVPTDDPDECTVDVETEEGQRITMDTNALDPVHNYVIIHTLGDELVDVEPSDGVEIFFRDHENAPGE